MGICSKDNPYGVEPDFSYDEPVNPHVVAANRGVERAIRNSLPPMDDVGDDVGFMLDNQVIFGPAPSVKLGPNPKQAYGDKKVAMHYVPPALLIYAALAFKEGVRKYGAYNWRSTRVEAMTYIGAVMRHVSAYLDGEDIDEESGKPHLALAIACLGILADTTEGGMLIDNRPPPGPAGSLIRKLAAGSV